MTSLAFLPGQSELWIVLFLILLLFGGRKLPELSRALGKSLREFKRGREDVDEDEDSETHNQRGSGKTSER